MLLTERDTETQSVSHNDFVVKDRESPGYFFIASGEVGAYLHVTTGCHLCVQESAAPNTLLGEMFVIENLANSADLRFMGHGHLRNAGNKWRREHCTRYRSSLVPENHDLSDEVDFCSLQQHCFGLEKSQEIFRERSGPARRNSG